MDEPQEVQMSAFGDITAEVFRIGNDLWCFARDGGTYVLDTETNEWTEKVGGLMTEQREFRIVVFEDKPLHIAWITREGKTLLEQIVTMPRPILEHPITTQPEGSEPNPGCAKFGER